MYLAKQAWEAGNPVRVLALLESQRPKVDEDDLRTFEWYYLWRLCQGGLRHHFPMIHHDNVAAMALSPDGQTLATGFDQTTKLWDTRTGREKLALTGHRGLVEGLAFTPDGRSLVSADGLTIRLWDLASGKERAVLSPGPGYSCDHVAIAGDGNTLVLGGDKVTLWDLSQGKQMGVVASGAKPSFVNAGGVSIAYLNPAIAADGQAVAARCDQSVVKVWVKEGGAWQERHSLQGHGWGYSAAFSPDGKTLAVSGGQVRCYDVATGQVRLALEGHKGTCFGVNYSADGKALITAAQDKTARVWDAATGRQIACFAHSLAVHGAMLSADGKVAATASGVIRVWDTTPPQDSFVLKHTTRVGGVGISSDGKTLASAGAGGTRLWNLDGVTGQSLRLPADPPVILSLPGPQAAHYRGACLALSRDGKTLAVPEPSGGNIALWSAAGEKLAVLEGHTTPVTRLAMSPDGKSLASISASPEGILWDVPTRKPRAKIQIVGGLSAVAFSPDGKTLAVGSQFGAAKLFDATTGREIATLHRYELAVDWADAVAFSPDGQLVAVGSRGGLVQVWEVATGRLHVALRSHDNWGCYSLAFSPDGRTLATGDGGDGTVKLWDVATGQERYTLKGHQGAVQALEFTPDGNTLITGSNDGTVRLWPAAVDANARARKAELETDVPGTPAALNEQGDGLWQYGRTEEAEKAYAQAGARLEKLAATFPDSPGLRQEMVRSLLSRSLLLEQTGRPQEAGPLRERAHEIYRNLSLNDQQTLIWAYCERGRKLNTIQNRRQAERTFRQALDLAPTHERARSWQRNVYVGLGEWNKVVADCSQLIELNPDDAKYWCQRGNAFAQLKQYDKAVADYSKAIELQTDNAVFWSNRGNSYRMLGQWDRAIADYSKAIKLKPEVPTYWRDRGNAHANARQWDKAIADYSKAIELKPDDASWRNARGNAYFSLSQWDKAIADYSKAIELQTDNAVFWSNRAGAYAELKQWQKADADSARAIELKSTNPVTWYKRALVAMHLGDTKSYRQTCREMLEQFGKSDNLATTQWTVWTCVLAADGVADSKVLLQLSEKALADAPKNYRTLNPHGALLYRIGRYQEALQWLTEAEAAYRPDDDKLSAIAYNWFFLAMAHHRLGHVEEAKIWHDKAIQWIDQKMQRKPEDPAAANPLPWNRLVTVELLRREAEELLKQE